MTIAKFQGGDAVTMTSLELVEFINGRRAEDDPALDHGDFLKKVPKVLGACAGNFSATYEVPGPRGGFRLAPCYRLPKRESCLMAMTYSYALQAAVFDYMTDLEQKLAKPMTQAQLIAASANLMVDMERRQTQTEQAVAGIERRVEDLSQTTVWDHCPQNCQSLTRIKEAMLARHGLSGAVVDYVLKAWPNQPNPAGMVRNGHEEALGSQYLVWSKSHVTAGFHRFVSESTMVTATQATHPYFEGRFRLVQKVPQ
ncbi:phage antirepressor [Pseudomonas proteolytica]|uniref:phage antirepressor n=1 Tax=Pseudomonas proteolytica TaxID=219574 RepID=UPI001475C123|nr:phage antirepressor [Pseudomonas proteolytica]